MFRLNDRQGAALAALAVALRPDWVGLNPAGIFWAANQAGGLPGADFRQCVLALLVYAEDHRTPNLFVLPGPHWDMTAEPSGDA